MYESGPDGLPRVTGLRMTKAGKEEVVEAHAYVAALDVPGAKRLIPQVGACSAVCHPTWSSQCIMVMLVSCRCA